MLLRLAGQRASGSPVMAAILQNIFTVYIVVGAVVLVVLFLYPMDRKMAEEELKRVGLTNHEGEASRLLSRRNDCRRPHITIWVFDSRGISIQEWRDKQGRIETALDITIANIRNVRGKRRIALHAVPTKNDLPDFIQWKDSYLSHDDFVLTLGEEHHGAGNGCPYQHSSCAFGYFHRQRQKRAAEAVVDAIAVQVCGGLFSDFKVGVDFPPVWHECCQMCFDEKTLLELLTGLVDELERRKKLFAAQGYSALPHITKAPESLKRLIFACDEVAEILDQTGADSERMKQIAQIESKLATIARLGRAFGIHLNLATQRPDVQLIPGQIRNNINYRACGRADTVLSAFILDNSNAAEQIPKNVQGRFPLHDGTVFQAYWFDEGCL